MICVCVFVCLYCVCVFTINLKSNIFFPHSFFLSIDVHFSSFIPEILENSSFFLFCQYTFDDQQSILFSFSGVYSIHFSWFPFLLPVIFLLFFFFYPGIFTTKKKHKIFWNIYILLLPFSISSFVQTFYTNNDFFKKTALWIQSRITTTTTTI